MSKQNNSVLNLAIEELQTNYRQYFNPHKKLQLIPITYLERAHSFIWKCRIDGNSTRQGIYIKHYKKHRSGERCKIEYEILKSLYEAFDQYPLYSVVKPIACFPEYSIIITADVKGENLSDQIKQGAKHVFPDRTKYIELERYCLSAAEWLRIFQSLTKISRRIPLSECGLMESILKALQCWDTLGIDSGIQYHIIHYFERQISKLGSEMIEMSGQHGDFVPHNVIVNHERIIVFDFPQYKDGPIYYDVARFYASLLRYPNNPRYNSEKINQLLNIFIEGYKKETDFSCELFDIFVNYHMVNALPREESLSGKALLHKCYRKRVISCYLQWFREKCN